MFRDYKIRREAREAVAARLSAVGIITNMKAPPPSSIIEPHGGGGGEMAQLSANKTAAAATEATARRSVETQTLNKAPGATVTFKALDSDAPPPPATVTAAPAVVAATADDLPMSAATLNSIRASLGLAANILEGDAADEVTASKGRYTNWSGEHTALSAAAWCCIGDLLTFCDRYGLKVLGVHDTKAHQRILAAVRAFLQGMGAAPFHMRRRFPADIRNAENLWVCVDRCPSVEYHLKRIISIFRRPLSALTVDKQRAAIQTFHLAVNELRLDISARITQVRLYDRLVFERDFHLTWADEENATSACAEKSSALELRKPIVLVPQKETKARR